VTKQAAATKKSARRTTETAALLAPAPAKKEAPKEAPAEAPAARATPAPREPARDGASPAAAKSRPADGAAAAAKERPAAGTPAAAKPPRVDQTAAIEKPQPSVTTPAVAKPRPADRAATVTGAQPAERAPATAKARRSGETPSRLFVLDTNVLMHDPGCLFRFAEHDVYLPMTTLEELDDHKKGMSEVSRNARQVSRTLDELIAAAGRADITSGIALAGLGNREAGGRLFFPTQAIAASLPPGLQAGLQAGKADNLILGIVRALQEQWHDRQVVLVSKDINMRIKARTLGLAAEDYYNDQVLEDTDLLYTGVLALPENFWDRHGKRMESWQQGGQTFYRVSGPLVSSLLLNQFVWFDGEMPLLARVQEKSGRTAVLQTLRDYGHGKNAVWGITARNREQNFGLNLLMDPDIDFVSLLGQAGTGKTLLALAAGLAQVFESKRYTEIVMTRATVPVGEDIGYLPGTEEEKMQPWMGALEDNLEVLNRSDPAAGDWGRAATSDLIRARVRVKAMSFMRGRTFTDKYLIVDEAQNLTPKQMKTLVTRAGPGTKVVCLGNIAQIDTPWLTEGSSGLTYVVDRFKGWPHAGHVTLQRGERSRLAEFATEVL